MRLNNLQSLIGGLIIGLMLMTGTAMAGDDPSITRVTVHNDGTATIYGAFFHDKDEDDCVALGTPQCKPPVVRIGWGTDDPEATPLTVTYYDDNNITVDLPGDLGPGDYRLSVAHHYNLNPDDGSDDGSSEEKKAAIWDLTVGAVGPQGVQGKLGPQGEQGVQGKLGPQGDQGVQGKLGPQGDQGVQGKLGAQGDQGVQGKLGSQGDQGVQGKLGPAGADGSDGDQGVQGKLGPQGDQGVQGKLGPQGGPGMQGVQGKLGPQGEQGKIGPQGIQGANGLQSLLTVTPEPAGANCAAGGVKIENGLDDNNNSVLNPAEVDGTSFVCNGVTTACADRVCLTGTPDPATVFDTIEVTYYYSNNLSNGIWHGPSNTIIAGDYVNGGYWAHPAFSGGYPVNPDNDTGVLYRWMVHMPTTNLVVRAGGTAGVAPPQHNDLGIGTIDPITGALSSFSTPSFGDGFTGTVFAMSSSPTEFMIFDGANIRRYLTTAGSNVLTPNGVTALSSVPFNACSPACYSGAFAWDGVYYYFAEAGGSFTSPSYYVFEENGTLLGNFPISGGTANGVYFDWSVGRYTVHSGYGNYGGGSQFTYTGGPFGDDSQAYHTVSTAHTVNP